MRPKNGKALETAQNEIKEAFGFVPDFYEALPESVRASAWSTQRDLEMSETALDNKTKELIGLAIASHIKCKYCIYFHTEAARLHGASRAELAEASAMGGVTVLFSNAITGAQTDFEHFRNEVDRGMQHMLAGQKKQRKGASPPAE